MKKIILQNTKISLGTCSWKYDSWEGIVYRNTPTPEMLRVYAEHFASVEIDQWFWSLHNNNKVLLPQKADAVQYCAATPDDFTFTIKAPNSITLTHYYQKNKSEPLIVNPHFLSEELLHAFLASIEPLLKKTGMIMLQFEYLNKQKMPSQEHFLQKLHEFALRLPKDIPFGIEIRNPNFLNQAYFTFLQEHGLHAVFLQGYYMPEIFPVIKKFRHDLLPSFVIRLHGPDRSGIEKLTKNTWNAIVESKENELRELAAMLMFLAVTENDIYINVNNHYEGSAPLTIQRIQDLINPEKIQNHD